MPGLGSYRRDLALKASSLKLVTTGVLYAGAYQGIASGSDAARWIVSSDLAASNLAGTAAEIPSTAKDFQWTFIPTTGEQRRIVKNGYAGYNAASEVLTGHNAGADAYIVGYTTVDRAHLSTLSANITAEILGRFPVLSSEEMPGLHWAINEALAVMHGPRHESITGDATRRIDISSTLPWAKRPEQLIRVFSPDGDDGRGPQPMLGKAWLEPDGEKMWLHIPDTIALSTTFTAQFRRPYSTWILVKRTARASVTVTAGAVAAVTLVDGGVGYSGTATATISGVGTGATVTVTVAGGAVTGFSGLVGGSGYVQASTAVTISAPTTTTWATSTVGLVNDEDEALPEVDRVTAVAYWQLCKRMARKGPKPQQQEWEAEAKLAGDAAADFVTYQVEPPTPRRNRRLPTHPTGKAWRPMAAGSRRWP